ncbi:MAG TPA: hypothetical protein VJ865_08465 [Gemmatimonadaceae bacterium]|nr:hypothetical protein [Gemmatimonadaceae bacterium]
MKTSLTFVGALALALVTTPALSQTKPRPQTVRADTSEAGYVSAMKKDLRAMATAEEAYFVDHATYYSGPINTANPLYGFSPSAGVVINVSAPGGAAMWTAVASHARTPTKCTYQLPAPIECVSPAPASPPAPPAASDRETDRAATTETAPEAEASSVSSSPDAQVITIGDTKPVGIRPGQSRNWGFEIGSLSSSCLAMGQIEVLSGGDRNVSVVIVRESSYKDWAENRPVRTEYESGERPVIAFDVNINDAGRYLLVVSNASRAASKVVQLQHVTVTCVK